MLAGAAAAAATAKLAGWELRQLASSPLLAGARRWRPSTASKAPPARYCGGLREGQLDQSQAGTTVALVDEGTAKASILASHARGYMDERSLAEVFAWLRPDDLIWNYWVNNYLQGKPPAPFDILHWNADTTRMPAALHATSSRSPWPTR